MAPHQCTLVVAGFLLGIEFVSYAAGIRVEQEIFTFNAGFYSVAFFPGDSDVSG